MDVRPADECELIKDIVVNMNPKGETAEEVKTGEVHMEEPFDANINEGVGSQTEMDVSVSEVNDEETERKVELKNVKVEGGEENVTAGPSARRESGEYIEEDDTEFKFDPPKKKPKIVSERESKSVGEDCEIHSETRAKCEVPEEEANDEREEESGEDSDSDFMTPESYDRQAKMEALYREQLGIVIEDGEDTEERQVGLISTTFLLPFIFFGSFR